MHNIDFATKVLSSRGTCLFSTGQAGFIIKSSSGQLLAIDLYLSNCVERQEGHKGFKRLLPQILNPAELEYTAIITTHPHLDHFDIDSVPEMMAHGSPKLFASVSCEKLVHQTMVDYYNSSIHYVRPEDKATVGEFKLSFVNCDHGEDAPDAVGVVVEVDGHAIYEVGDSCLRLDRVDEIKQITEHLDVLIAPINGINGNMDSAGAAKLADKLQPKVTIPCHYGMFASHGGNVKEFYDLRSENKQAALIMQQGEGYKL